MAAVQSCALQKNQDAIGKPRRILELRGVRKGGRSVNPNRCSPAGDPGDRERTGEPHETDWLRPVVLR